MSNYLIERTVPSAWVHSSVAGDNMHCLYNAPDPEIIGEHARCGGFPANLVTPVATIIDPITAEA